MAKKEKSKRIPIIGQYYEERSKNLNAQRTINWYPISTEDGKAPKGLVPTPGSKLCSANQDISQYNTIDSSIIYDKGTMWCIHRSDDYPEGIRTFKPAAIQATGNITPYFVKANYSSTSDSYNWGIGITQDQTNVYYVCPTLTKADVVNSNYMWINKANTNANGFIATYPDSRLGDITYIKGYLVASELPVLGVEANTRGFFYANFSGGQLLKYGQFQVGEDTIARTMSAGGYLYLMGLKHYEVWNLVGNTDFPFVGIDEASKEIGLAHRESIVKHENMIFFVGVTEGGGFGVYVLKGLESKKISTPVVDALLESRLRRYSDVIGGGNLGFFSHTEGGALCYTEDGHTFVSFHLPPLAGDDLGYNNNATQIVYDIATDAWHERQQNSSTTQYARHVDAAVGYGGNVYLRDDQHTLLQYDKTKNTDYLYDERSATYVTAPVQRTRTSQKLSGEDNFVFHDRLRVDTYSNTTISHDTNVDANIYLYSSDNDGKTWNAHGGKSLENASYGNISGDKRHEWFRLGRSDDRIYKVFTNANAHVYIDGAFVDLLKGSR